MDGGTWWTFTVAPAPYYTSVVPWGATQAWVRWADEAEDQSNFHVERSANGGAWTQILQYQTYQYVDPTPPCGPVAYRVRAHWHAQDLYSAYGPVVNFRACAPVAPGPLYVREWWGATRPDWTDQSWDESDFHVERQVDWSEWEPIAQLGAGTQNYVDSAQVCGLVAYRVRAHRHDSGQYSEYSNVASRTRACSEPTVMMTPIGGGFGVAGPRAGDAPAAPGAQWLSLAWWRSLARGSTLSMTFGVLVGLALAGALLLGGRRGRRRGPETFPRRTARTGVPLTRASRRRRVPRLASRLAGIGSVLLAALLLPTSVLAQAGQVVEFYHLDALGSVRAVSNQQGQIISRHEYLPFGEEWTPGTPQRENKLFTGKERDPETNFDYFGARYYDQRVGRFTTIDPVQTTAENLVDPQRWNRYAYVRNNPMRWVDPDGRVAEEPQGQQPHSDFLGPERGETFAQFCERKYGKFKPIVSSTLPTGLKKEAYKIAREKMDAADALTLRTNWEEGFDVRSVNGKLEGRVWTDNDSGDVCWRNGEGTLIVWGHSHVPPWRFGELTPSGFESTRGGDRSIALSLPTVFHLLTQPGGKRWDFTGGTKVIFNSK